MVLVAERHPCDAVHEGAGVARVVGDLVGVVVRLDVRLVDHIEAEFVREVVQRRVVRVVRGADRVEPELLQQHEIGAHVVVRHRPPGQRMEVVPVDAPDVDPLAVEEQVPAADLDLAETDAMERGVGDRAVGAVQPDGQPVQLGCLRRPRADLVDDRAQAYFAEEVGDAAVLLVEAVELRVLGDELGLQLPGDVPARGERARGVPHLAVHPQLTVEPGPHGHIGQIQRIGRVQQYGAGDAAVPPLVLVLKVRGVRPLHDGESHGVGRAGAYDGGEVELGRQMRVLGDTDGPTVDVDEQHALGGAHLEHDPPARPLGRNVDLTLVHARRVGRWRRGRELAPRHLGVGVPGRVVGVLEGPGAGDLGRGPVVAHRGCGGREELEAPVAVEGESLGAPVDGVHGQAPPGSHLG